MALPVVLWTVAALSLLLGNLVQFSRVESQMTAELLYRQKSQVDHRAALVYVTQALMSDRRLQQHPPVEGQLSLDDRIIRFRLVNAAGLIDMNYGDDMLLSLLLSRALGWTPPRVQSFLEQRRRLPAPAFASWEDVYQRSGMERSELDRLLPYATVQGGTTGVNVLLAPLDVLHLLRPDNARAVQSFDESRNKPGALPDFTLINSPHHQTVSAGAFRLDVGVAAPDGRVQYHRYWLVPDNRRSAKWQVIDQQNIPDT